MKFNRTLSLMLISALCILLAGCAAQQTQEPKEYISELPEIKEGSYPSSFDLRDYGYITSVKSQQDLGCCWAFASIAAAESSILSELKTNINDNALNLSEHHLLWFAKSHLPAEGEDGYDASESQSGEGFYVANAASSASSLVAGADNYTAMLTFAAGMGVASEETAPFQNKKGNVTADGDWSLDNSIRFSRVYDLEAGYVLPELKADGTKLNENGINAVKNMLTQGKAVAIEYAYDGDEETASASGESPYLNTKTYAHYTYEDISPNHCVTIVGWDDDYAKENFNQEHQPAGNGAWIVKNSWGASTEKKPNNSKWGVDGSGYFYLSYYDQSVTGAVAYDFDTTASGSAYTVVQQYDYMNAYAIPQESKAEVKEANVFTAENNMELQAVGILCAAENTHVKTQVYLLDESTADISGGTLVTTLDKDYRYGGYYRETLEKAVSLEKGQRYAIVVTQMKLGIEQVYYYQYGESLQGRDSLIAMFSGAYSAGVINKGESYIYSGQKGWQNLTDFIAADNASTDNSVAYDNFCIKAFGNLK